MVWTTGRTLQNGGPSNRSISAPPASTWAFNFASAWIPYVCSTTLMPVSRSKGPKYAARNPSWNVPPQLLMATWPDPALAFLLMNGMARGETAMAAAPAPKPATNERRGIFV